VHGLTTAITVWCCAAVGCLAAAGYFEESLITTLLIIAVNLILKPLDEWLSNRGGNIN
jgi:putative Mg2+ transporter-C (MgtC) family protein